MLVSACATPAPAVAPSPALRLTRCQVAKSTAEARCGTLEVFEDRAAKTGRVIPINILVLPALTERPAPDPIFVLAGGPGLGAASAVDGNVVDFFRPMRMQRDVVFVDQRGTGESHPPSCPPAARVGASAPLGEMLPADRIRACREALEKVAA